MNKNQQGFSLVEILVLVIVVALIGVSGWLVYSSQHPSKQILPTQQKIPNSVESAADDFLISKVGKDKFKQYYTFDKSRSSYANPKDSRYDFLAYHFSPWKAVTDFDDIIMVQVNRNNLKEVSSDAVPDCIKDTSYCDFGVDKKKALTIAKQNSITDNVVLDWRLGVKGLPFVIVASNSSQNRAIYIDYRNGAVLGNASIGQD